jgi:hypothetical protein
MREIDKLNNAKLPHQISQLTFIRDLNNIIAPVNPSVKPTLVSL